MIYCVTSYQGLGCTFLDWSIHYLSGQTQFHNINLGELELVHDPLTNLGNAHRHKKNHPNGLEETRKVIEWTRSVEHGLVSFYPAPCNFEEDDTVSFSSLLDKQMRDYAGIWQECSRENIPVVFVSIKSDPLYVLEPRSLDQSFLNKQKSLSLEEQKHVLIQYFFGDKINSSNTVWDQREQLALSIRPLNYLSVEKYLDLSTAHLYIDARELWHDGEALLRKILKYLDLNLYTTRLDHWKKIYYNWQQSQTKILKFSWNLDHICKSIVVDDYYDLTEYNLDLWKEAVIQHVILYKYGLNFKGWHLEKFPNNTKELHKLLEPNQHNIEDIYKIRGIK